MPAGVGAGQRIVLPREHLNVTMSGVAGEVFVQFTAPQVTPLAAATGVTTCVSCRNPLGPVDATCAACGHAVGPATQMPAALQGVAGQVLRGAAQLLGSTGQLGVTPPSATAGGGTSVGRTPYMLEGLRSFEKTERGHCMECGYLGELGRVKRRWPAWGKPWLIVLVLLCSSIPTFGTTVVLCAVWGYFAHRHIKGDVFCPACRQYLRFRQGKAWALAPARDDRPTGPGRAKYTQTAKRIG